MNRVRNDNVNSVYYTWFDSPVGSLLLAGSSAGLKLVSFAVGNRARSVDPEWQADNAAFVEVVDQLQSYFAGDRKNFELDLVLEGTDFQKKVLTPVKEIPHGEHIPEKELA